MRLLRRFPPRKYRKSLTQGAIATFIFSILVVTGVWYFLRVPPQTPRRRHYSPEEVSYFLEVGLGSEYNGRDRTVKKWQGEIRVGVFGSPTVADLEAIATVVAELNELTQGIHLVKDRSHPNRKVYLVPPEQFRDYLPDAIPGNYGFFWAWWEDHQIHRAIVLISTVEITQTERNHLIREEITQSLGLMRDSWRYQDSIFYEGWTDTTEYTQLDRAVISLLYEPEILPGMSEAEVLEAVRQINLE